MGRTCELLPPSEALPAIGDHCVVFHNGRGFYFACREYSTSLEKRQFQCVRAECGVTASMGPELGSPLQDHGSHTHPADWEYRDKCLLLHTIKQRFLRENASAPLILQEILASLSLKNEEDNQDTWDFESVTIDEESPSLMIKEEPYLDPINENSELTELNDSSTVLQSTKRTYSRVRSIEKDWTDHSSSDVEEEDTDDGLGFIVVKGDELCERLGIPEKSLDDPVHELEGTDKNRKRKQLLCKRKESLQEQAEESTSFFLQPVKRMYKSRTKENTSVEASFSKQKEKGDDDPELVVLKEEEREVIIIDERLESSEDSSETVENNRKVSSYRRSPHPDEVNGELHLPEIPKFQKNRSRCRFSGCKLTARVRCRACRVYLCLTASRNCFSRYHQIDWKNSRKPKE
uniref:FLYWCH-type domain-containing protein n=1 Tax=Graphocephala atropunctata TaxID=36148 RepID=A0A1B6LZ89_9HEMI